MLSKLMIVALLVIIACKSADQSAPAITQTPAVVNPSSEVAGSPFTNIPVEEFIKSYRSAPEGTAMLLDVRTPPEYNDGYIKGAVLINYLDDDIDQQLAALDRSKKYFVYCQVGGRSNKCMEKMKALGFTQVFNLAGGYEAYSKSGLN
jgi:phage shock protein E